jgi:putative phosphoribosyl transferase
VTTPLGRAVEIGRDGVVLNGDLEVPATPHGTVVFAHGSGSSRHSPRNRMVAARLRERGLATLLVDLLTTEEERIDASTGHLRFDIGLLADRLTTAAAWVHGEPAIGGLPLGYFGASTGAGAALVAAARQPAGIAAVVSRGGRPDLAGEWLAQVEAPTLLIVGSRDDVVIEMNHEAARHLRAPWRIETVEGATHLFEEPGALERVASLAGDWFHEHLATPSRKDAT